MGQVIFFRDHTHDLTVNDKLLDCNYFGHADELDKAEEEVMWGFQMPRILRRVQFERCIGGRHEKC